MTDLVLQPREFRFLEGLTISPRKSFPGRTRGERLTQKKGLSIEFADYREYAEGDDLRHLDWNVLARLETPIMKTYRDEEDLAVHVLLDVSASMDFGEPTKLEQAKRLACALGWVALEGGDAVYARLIGAKEPPFPVLRGRAAYPRLANWARARVPVEAGASGNGQAMPGLASGLRQFVNSGVRTGVVVLISDGMDPEAPGLLRALGGRGHEILFLQVLSDLELDPDLEGDLRLVDAEGAGAVEVTANSYTMREYRRRLTEHNDALRDATLKAGGRHATVRTDESLEHVVKEVLRRGGWVA